MPSSNARVAVLDPADDPRHEPEAGDAQPWATLAPMRREAGPDKKLLVRIIRTPSVLAALDAREFSRAIDAAEHARLLGWLLNLADAQGAPAAPPSWLHDRLVSARHLVAEYDRSLRWETDRLRRAFADEQMPWVLLKGAGYLAARLPPGRGRRVADIDVMVPFADLSRAERALQAHGWVYAKLDAYDERYYREWMHELPPMVHRDRESIVDLHHGILPRTSRLKPSSERLLERAVDVGGGVRVLCPSHMILHAAAHLFHDGEIAGAIRDVVDLDGLLRSFEHAPGFWDDLIVEAQALELTRPAFYALRYASRMVGTPVPEAMSGAMSEWAPPAPVLRLMDSFVETAVQGPAGPRASTSAFALYVRSHWLKMPPVMLVRHLLRKSLRRE